MAPHMRYHVKSRKGCFSCKTGRVKCDEVKPRCSRCKRRGNECIYNVASNKDSTGDSTGDSVVSRLHDDVATTPVAEDVQSPLLRLGSFDNPSYNAKQVLDLRLMHHYTLHTCISFSTELPKFIYESLVGEIPHLAFHHDFLLDTLLFVAMVHLGCTQPDSLSQLPVYLYKQQALRSLRHAVSSLLPSSERGIKGASILLAAVSFAADRLTQEPGLWITNWLTLVSGQRHFPISWSEESSPPTASETFPKHTRDLPLNLKEVKTPVDIQRVLRQEVDGESQEDLDILQHVSIALGEAISKMALSENQSSVTRQVKSFFFNMEKAQDFLSMFREENPKALVVLAYCVSLFGLVPRFWLYEGVVEHDVGVIVNMLGNQWKEYVAVPQMISQMEDPSDVIHALYHCLKGETDP